MDFMGWGLKYLLYSGTTIYDMVIIMRKAWKPANAQTRGVSRRRQVKDKGGDGVGRWCWCWSGWEDDEDGGGNYYTW